MKREAIDSSAINYLNNVSGQLDVESREALSAGKLALEDADFYVRKSIKGASGTTELLKVSESEQTGIRNIDRAALPSLVNLVLQSITLGYATDASETDPKAVTYSSKKPSTSVPALENGELIIEQDDKPIVQIPVDRFFTEAESTQTKGVENAVHLKNFRLIKSERPFSIKLKCADGESVPDAEHFVELHLLGSKTRVR